MELELTPLDITKLSPAAARVLGPGIAGPAKMMAARGMAPMGPQDLATVIYQLSFDSENPIAQAANTTAEKLPDNILLAALEAPLDPRVLDFFAHKVLGRTMLIEKILLNKHVHNETLAFLGSKMGEREVEILAANQARLLQYPAIIEEIYLNKQARMSTVNRLLELAVRHGLTLNRLPMYEEIAAAILGQAPPAAPLTAEQQAQKDEELDANFKEGMEENAGAATAEKQDIDDKAVEEHEEKIKNLANAPIMVKIRRASLGTALDRSVLIKDPNKLVALSAIKAPAVNEQEAMRYASNRSLMEDVVRYIANKKEWHKNYLMKVILVNNPKCPLPIAMRFLTQLRPNDVKLIARSKNVPASLTKIAKEMSQKKK